MMKLLIPCLFLALALIGIALRKTYFAVPLKELKRRARKKDLIAEQLYRAAAYENSLRSLLWLYIGLTSALSLILFARQLPVWLSVLIVGPMLWIVFSLIPASRTTGFGVYIARKLSPSISWLLNYLHPILNRITDFVDLKYIAPKHTGLYEREDLSELIRQQQNQNDSRFSDEELDILYRTLNFSNYTVSDIFTPRSHVKIVLIDDVVGPILIDELHKNAQDYVLVRESKKGSFSGWLAYNSLDIKSSGHVKDFMIDVVYYLHEEDTLSEALHAFFVTNQPLFIVTNSFEEYVGIITIENIIQKLIGHIPGDDFDQFSDITAVAARHTKHKKVDEEHEDTVKTDDEVIE